MPFYFFQWTDAIIDHLEQHGISQDDFEAIVTAPQRRTLSRSTGRKMAFGYTDDHRYLACVFDLLDDEITVVPVTAYETD